MGSAAGTGFMSRASRAPAPSHVYRPTYQSDPYSSQRAGLDLTPQASMYSPNYFAMPTYTRPSAPVMSVQSTGGLFGRAPQPAYSIPYRTASSSVLPSGFGSRYPTFGAMRRTPEQQAASLNRSLQNNDLTYDQYQMMMAKPDLYLPYVQSVRAGNAPTTIGYQQRTSIPYMTEAQRQAYSNAQSRQLSELLGPAPADPSASDGGGA